MYWQFLLQRIPLSVILTFGYMLGICWQLMNGPAAAICALCIPPLVLLLVSQPPITKATILRSLLVTLILGICWFAGVFRTAIYQRTVSQLQQQLTESPLTLRARITDIREHSITCTLLEAHRCTGKLSLGTNAGIQLSGIPEQLTLTLGQECSITGVSLQATTSRHLLTQNILARARLTTKNKISVTQQELDVWSKFGIYRKTLLAQCTTKTNSQAGALIGSIIFGQSSAQLDPLRNYFAAWGISHYLARSGLHLMIFLLLLQSISLFIPLPWYYKQFLLLFLMLLYTLFSWPSVSFVRALMMTSYSLFALFAMVRPQGIHLIALVTLITLLYNPLFLCALDFQLSFGLTCALLIVRDTQQLAKTVFRQAP